MKPGDKIEVISGTLIGATGTIIKVSQIMPGGYMCKLTSLKPAEVKIFASSQIKVKS